MPLARIASYTCLGALFGTVFIWGFWPGAWNMGWPVFALLGLSAVSALVWGIFSLDSLRQWLKKRSTQFGISLAITALGALAILASINFLAATYNVKKDITKNRIHTLSDQSLKIAKELKEDIQLRVWTTGVDRMSANLDMRKFLENYRIASNGKIKVEIKNPNQERPEATKDNVKRDNLIIIRAAGSGRETRIENFNDTKGEEQITNGITQAIKGRKKTLCFLTGHGEARLDDAEPTGLSTVKTRLADSSYALKDISLATEEKVFADCEGLVIAGPTGDALDREIILLNDYLAKGGKMIALFGPGLSPSWKKLTAPFGVEVRSDIIIDPHVDPPYFVATANFAKDIDVVKGFNSFVFFPGASSIQVPTASKDGVSNIRTFVSSESISYAKLGDLKNIKSLKKGGSDLSGPFPVAVLITKPVEEAAKAVVPNKLRDVPKRPAAPPKASTGFNWIPEAHAQESQIPEGMGDLAAAADSVAEGVKKEKNEMSLILFSNPTFIANSVVAKAGNMDLFLNSVNYIMQDNELIGIRPRELRSASLELSLERLRMVYATVLLIAGLFAVLGIRASRRRSAL